MADPLRPTMLTRMRASIAGERDAVVLEALRAAGRAAYDELLAAESAPPGGQRLAAWNAFMLQTLGERFLDADYEASPGTVGFVPHVTFIQASAWLSAVEAWVSRARQARANPGYDLVREVLLPAPLPAWAEVEPCPAEHLTALLAAMPPIRTHVEVALYGLEKDPAVSPEDLARLRQLAVEAAAAADYALGLRTARHHPTLHELMERNLKQALELWFQLGQLAAMPQLLSGCRSLRPPPRPDPSLLPGGARFDPWCLTDPVSVRRWQHDARAQHALRELWRRDPDPAATLRLKAELDASLAAGDVAPFRTREGIGCYYECPWPPLLQTRREVRVAGRVLPVDQQFAMHLNLEEVLRGGPFTRGVVLGPFQSTDEVHY